KISSVIKEKMQDRSNEILVSAISFWEISLKFALNKLELKGFSPEDIPAVCLKMGFEIISLSSDETSTYHLLQSVYHKDPFDRMLIWQALQNDYTLISKDAVMKQYRSIGLKLLSP